MAKVGVSSMADIKKAEIKIAGMACAGCSGAVEKALRSISGVSMARVDLAAKTAFVEFNPLMLSLEDMKKAVQEAGYKVVEGRIV
ncbi:MAG: heavy-metal-associated domain-containing protein [Methanotrichaceae archaeon]